MLKESTVYLKWAADVADHWDLSRYARWAKDPTGQRTETQPIVWH